MPKDRQLSSGLAREGGGERARRGLGGLGEQPPALRASDAACGAACRGPWRRWPPGAQRSRAASRSPLCPLAHPPPGPVPCSALSSVTAFPLGRPGPRGRPSPPPSLPRWAGRLSPCQLLPRLLPLPLDPLCRLHSPTPGPASEGTPRGWAFLLQGPW